MTDHDDITVVDFANAFIGGGALTKGTAQEEILFLIYPQMFVSILFSARMNYNEALFIGNCRQYSTFTGYAKTLAFNKAISIVELQEVAADIEPPVQRRDFVAIDALKFGSKLSDSKQKQRAK